MARIGFHASHELFGPRRLLELAYLAEQAGFLDAMSSDHFHPWTESQGQSGFAWSWLGSALQATGLSFGTVNAPGQRYHPAIIAQAAATLAEMFPDRFWLAVGTGQALNEAITDDPWPPKPERRERLAESVGVIRALWAGEEVTHRGRVRVKSARLYSRPDVPPRLFGAAITEETAEWVGGWADGLITVGNDHEDLAKVIAAFRRGGGAGKPMYLQAALSWAPDHDEALRSARAHWPIACVGLGPNQDLPQPADFEREVADLPAEAVAEKVRVSADLDQHREWLRGDVALGFDAIYLHHVGPDPERFLETFGREVLPAFAE